MKPFYITTPIYYVNDKPHVGHAYSTIAADVFARFEKLQGRPARFHTGTDEHGLKLERAAEAKGIDPQAFVDQMAPSFREMAKAVSCEFDDFIRTTEPRHIERVQKLWSILEAKGDIYLGHYEDWYCVGCESFKTEKELVEKDGQQLCPEHNKPVERIKEESYFFRLSNYTDPLLAYYASHPEFVAPKGRFNEVKSFVKEGLRDLSISRTSFSWGVPVPSNPKHVMYVWLDALTNYMSALGGPAEAGEAELFDKFWGDDAEVIHIVGKDILRFHAVFWPAFLLSAGFPLPTQVWAHGWLTVNGEKMSKSLGNFIPPAPLAEKFGVDVLRYYLMRDVAFGQDGDFSHKNVLARYHGDLGNGLGNLLNRMVASIVKKSLAGAVPDVTGLPLLPVDTALIEVAKSSAEKVRGHFGNRMPHRALESCWELVTAANKYVDQTAPWALAKEGNEDRLRVVAYSVLESLRFLSVMLWPVMPERTNALRQQLGLPPLNPVEGRSLWPASWGELPANTKTAPGPALFPRIDDAGQAKMLLELGVKETSAARGAPAKPAKPKKAPKASPQEPGNIEFDDFMKVDLRLGEILSAERVPKSDKLFKLMIELGEDSPRQVLAGIAKHYSAEQLVGKRVVVAANLKPRKMMGLLSHGMVLAASDDDGLSVLLVDKHIKSGTRVS